LFGCGIKLITCVAGALVRAWLVDAAIGCYPTNATRYRRIHAFVNIWKRVQTDNQFMTWL